MPLRFSHVQAVSSRARHPTQDQCGFLSCTHRAVPLTLRAQATFVTSLPLLPRPSPLWPSWLSLSLPTLPAWVLMLLPRLVVLTRNLLALGAPILPHHPCSESSGCPPCP